jgi:hypothetical protein
MSDKHRPKRHEGHPPASGASKIGEPFRPTDLPPDESMPPGSRREAPSPGIPIPNDEYERLKEEAIRRKSLDDVPAQEDDDEDDK